MNSEQLNLICSLLKKAQNGDDQSEVYKVRFQKT